MRILLVNHDPLTASNLRSLFASYSYAVDSVNNVEDACLMASGDYYDHIIMSDQLTPDGDLIEESGGETYEELTNLQEDE